MPIGSKFIHQCAPGYKFAETNSIHDYICEANMTWSGVKGDCLLVTTTTTTTTAKPVACPQSVADKMGLSLIHTDEDSSTVDNMVFFAGLAFFCCGILYLQD